MSHQKAAVESSRQKPGPINPEDFVRESVREHNTLRQIHGVPPLSIAQDLCDVAQKWANYLIDNNKFEHNSSRFGENIAQKTGNPCTLDYAGCSKNIFFVKSITSLQILQTRLFKICV